MASFQLFSAEWTKSISPCFPFLEAYPVEGVATFGGNGVVALEHGSIANSALFLLDRFNF